MTQRCAINATASGLPLTGSAPHAQRWLIAEQRIPFAARALESQRLGEHIRSALETIDATIALARRARVTEEPERFWYADIAEGHYVSGRLDDLVDAVSRGETPLTAANDHRPQPALFVCANGKRDQCCALEARPIIERLAERDDVWECTHLGGHRFAPTALALPTGYVYGRLDADAALQILEGAGRGEIAAEHARGRTDLASAHQVADLAARTHGQPAGSWLARAETIATDDASTVVEIAYDNGARWQVDLIAHEWPALEESCGKPPVAQRVWLVEALHKG